jgi:hypothetical protein
MLERKSSYIEFFSEYFSVYIMQQVNTKLPNIFHLQVEITFFYNCIKSSAVNSNDELNSAQFEGAINI